MIARDTNSAKESVKHGVKISLILPAMFETQIPIPNAFLTLEKTGKDNAVA
jgi:hypothetical protein